jgi:serine/threonine-protein kinase
MTEHAKSAPVARVGRYEMGAEIASGGMATVYLARLSGAAGFEKLVALKRVHPHLAKEPTFVDMFLDEARIASRIQHPNVCQVFDFGEADGEFFIAMEFLVGETLAKLQRAVARSDYLNDPRRPFVCARLVADACEGLHAAHELKGRDGQYLNVVHRDISPQNLFVTFDGNVKVVDFGIASASDRLHQTSTGTVKGKFAYMAPEQAQGKKVDRRADVFALGVVLWELLAFKRLFRRPTPAETLVALMSEPIPPPSECSPLAPPELDAVVLKALERDPDARYATARELGRDLTRTLGRIGDAVDRAEVAEWLEGLFPDGRRRHEVLLESARWGEAEATELSDPSAVSDVVSRSSWSGVRPEEVVDPVEVEIIDEPEPAAAAAEPAASGPMEPTETLTAAEASGTSSLTAVPARTSPMRWVILAVVGLAIAVGTAAGVVLLKGEPEPAEAAASLPTQATAPEAGEGDEAEGGGAGANGEAVGAAGAAGAVGAAGATGAAPSSPNGASPDGEGASAEGAAADGDGEEEAASAEADEGAAAEDAEEDAEGGASGSDGRAARAARRRALRRARQRRRRAAAESQETGPGTVVVSTPGGWANVYDRHGRFLGETPLTVSLPAGRHRLSLRPFGQPPSRNVTVQVEAGETTRVRQSL